MDDQPPDLAALREQLQRTLLRDRYRLRGWLRSIEQAHQQGKPFDKNLARVEKLLQESSEAYQKRIHSRPQPTFEQELPINEHREEIAGAIEQHQVVVICGETGSGKSTQLPKILLDMGRGTAGMIGHTQPRRIAARSVATRVAEELGVGMGTAVGYKIRFADQTSPQTHIKLMTDGILLAESQHDRFFDQYDTIIVDEAHERSLNIDFLLGCLQRILPKRPELRLIITSATIDAQRFAAHFRDEQGPAPVIEVSGRSYPVDILYQEPEEDSREEVSEQSLLTSIGDAAEELSLHGPGDILVFLPTERDIRDTAKYLRGRLGPSQRSTEILPLYGRLSTAEQNRVFAGHAKRRIVLATNVAESSLTVPGIHYVIDSGTARISRYSPRSQVQRLPIEAVSRASADQRAGRCGRIAPGICIRLYSEEDYLGRDRFATPEIQRTNLASVILQTLALRLGKIEEFPFLDPPRPEAIRDGYKILFELGAIDDHRRLTETGKQLARLPVDPRIGRMILAGEENGCLQEILIIAAALELQDPRERPAEKQQQADEAHRQFADEKSDFLSYLQLWDFFHRLKSDLSRSRLRKACQQNFLSFTRMREWQDVRRQLQQSVEQFGFKPRGRREDPDAIHRALLVGLLAGLAYKTESQEYLGAGGTKSFLWPGSATKKQKPQWVMAAESVETSRRFLRTLAPIDPSWIEPLAPHLIKCSFSDPHWDRRSARVMAYERLTLFGLPVVARRRRAFGHLEPEIGRQIFIREGLVNGEYRSQGKFQQANRDLLDTIASLAAKTRRRDLIVEDHMLEMFYEERVPEECYDGRSFERWRRKAEKKQPQVLHMTEADLLGEAGPQEAEQAYPSKIQFEGSELPLEYKFEPGTEYDGVTLIAPQESLAQLHPGRISWGVPGLLEEKVVAAIKSLPKSLRRLLIPAPDVARAVASRIDFGVGSFEETLSAELSKVAEERITPGDFNREKIPAHLQMNIRVIDPQGEQVAEGRDLNTLREQLGVDLSNTFVEVSDQRVNREGITSWDFGELPKTIELDRGGAMVSSYPTLIDQLESVSMRVVDNKSRAEAELRRGVIRLFALERRSSLKEQATHLPMLDKAGVIYSRWGQSRPLREELIDLLAARTALPRGKPPREEEAFRSMVKEGRQRLPAATQEVAKALTPLWSALLEAQLSLEEARPPQWQFAVEDMRAQLAELTSDRFLSTTPWQWLQNYPRYAEAICRRIEKLRGGLPRDEAHQAELTPRIMALAERRAEHEQRGVIDPELITYRWMLEEYRVSLFAQELGVAVKVSPQRLEKQWAKIV